MTLRPFQGLRPLGLHNGAPLGHYLYNNIVRIATVLNVRGWKVSSVILVKEGYSSVSVLTAWQPNSFCV